jgi:phosphotransferase family enzyme
MTLAPDTLTTALTSVFSHNGHARGRLTAVDREPTPYVTTFPCEVVTCRFTDGRLRLFCKFGARNGPCSHGQRGGVAYEAEVYRQVLKPFGASAPGFFGSYTDPKTSGTWLVLEYLNRSLRVGKIPGLRAVKLAARWIGEFHAASERLIARASTSFLTSYDAAYYRGWPRRALRLARHLGLRLAGLEALIRRLEREIAVLAALPKTVIHGEYYPHNIMFQAGVVRPVDWETAAVAPGEIDLATFTEGWPLQISRQLEAEYQRARWPAGAPADFQHNLDLARIYMQLRWLGDDDPKWTGNLTRWRRLYGASRRLQLI